MEVIQSRHVEETRAAGARLARRLKPGAVVALTGGLGMGKTAFISGMAQGLGLDCGQVSSPTFALVHEYDGPVPLFHFDMYRVTEWDDLYSTGFFDYLERDGILAVEWSENIAGALPDETIFVDIARGGAESDRRITITGENV